MDFDDLLLAAEEIQRFLNSRGWSFCIIGGVALQRWGEIRFTQDVDLTLLTGFGEEEKYVDPLLAAFTPREKNAREFSLQKRVLLLQTAGGIALDIALGAFPFEENSIRRSSLWEVEPGRNIRTCSAEDLLVHKVFAGRDKDWGDAETILTRQKDRLDFKLIRAELQPLLELKGETEAFAKLDRMIERVNRRTQ